jgi:hypothetical protein
MAADSADTNKQEDAESVRQHKEATQKQKGQIDSNKRSEQEAKHEVDRTYKGQTSPQPPGTEPGKGPECK